MNLNPRTKDVKKVKNQVIILIDWVLIGSGYLTFSSMFSKTSGNVYLRSKYLIYFLALNWSSMKLKHVLCTFSVALVSSKTILQYFLNDIRVQLKLLSLYMYLYEYGYMRRKKFYSLDTVGPHFSNGCNKY